MKSISLFFLIFAALVLDAQVNTNNVTTALYNEATFVNLKKNREQVMKIIPAFLDKTMSFPQNLKSEEIEKEHQTYLQLTDEYNAMIEKLKAEVNSKTSIEALRNLSFDKHAAEANAVCTKYSNYMTGLGKYHKEASAMVLITTLIAVGNEIYKFYKNEKIVTLKSIYTTELEALKLPIIDWNSAISAVSSNTPKVDSKSKTNLINTAEYYKILELDPPSDSKTIETNFISLSKKYGDLIETTQNQDIKSYFSSHLEKINAANEYFKKNPPKAVSETTEITDSKQNNGNSNELKARIQGVLDVYKSTPELSKEMLINTLEGILQKY